MELQASSMLKNKEADDIKQRATSMAVAPFGEVAVGCKQPTQRELDWLRLDWIAIDWTYKQKEHKLMSSL
jgi:hypothetical protein